MTAPFKIGNAIACEHIVEGANNKHTLINTFSGDLLVGEFPAAIYMAFYVELLPLRKFNGSMDIVVRVGKKDAVKGEGLIALDPKNPSVFVFPGTILRLSGPMAITLELRVEGCKPIKAVKKNVLLRPSQDQAIA